MHRPVRHVSVRARSALAAMGAVALALVVASLGLLGVLQRSVESTAVSTAATRAHDVAAELTTDGVDGLNLAPGPGDPAYVQIVADGAVVAASPALADDPPLTTEPGVPGAAHRVTGVELPGPDGGPFVTVVLGVPDVALADTVLVRQSYAAGRETVEDAAQAMLVAVPLLVAVVGAVTYWLTGRALRPVEQIRRRTAQIGEADLTTRIGVPDTGDEVAALAVTLNGMLDRLHDAQQAQVRFVADASHELRSPLAVVRAEIDVATRHPAGADWPATAAVVRAANDRMQRLVDDLLVLTRTAESGAPERDQDVDLDDVVEQVGFALRPSGVLVEVATEPVRVRGNPAELGRAVQNLADNAVRHADQRAWLTLRRLDGRAVIEVADDGAGVPLADREVIFDRFARLDEGRARSAGGSGLGLAIVRGIVTAHGGTVRAGASTAGGALFTIELACVEAGRADHAPSSETAPD